MKQQNIIILFLVLFCGTITSTEANPFLSAFGEVCKFSECQVQLDDDDQFFPLVDVDPEFPGGVKNLMEFISKNLRYPAYAANNHIQGKVSLSFVVEKDGSISNIKEISSPSEDLTKEAMRVVQSMPRWKPGMLNGTPTRVKFVLPITFRLGSANTLKVDGSSERINEETEN